MKTKLTPLILALLSVLFSAGCSRSADADCCEIDSPAAKNPSALRHPLKGVVVELFADRNEVRVKHDEIPDFMSAMTMNFKVNPSVFQQLKVADPIAADVFNSDGLWLENIRRIETKGGEVLLSVQAPGK